MQNVKIGVVWVGARVEQKEQKKMDRYQDLARELKKLWKEESKVIPIVHGWSSRDSGKRPREEVEESWSKCNC